MNKNDQKNRKTRRLRRTMSLHDKKSSSIMEKIEDLSFQLQKPSVIEYLEYAKNPKKVILMNFLSGIARGFGAVIGATVVVALFLYFLSFLISLNIPLIGKYIAYLVKIVEKYL